MTLDPKTQGWRAKVIDDDYTGRVETVGIYRLYGNDQIEYLAVEGGEIVARRQDANVVTEDGAHLRLPRGAAQAIAEALKPGPSQGEVALLEDALKAERERVDSVLTAFLYGGGDET